MPDRVWIVGQYYWPDDTSSGHSVTRIAEGLARHHPTAVITGYPGYVSKHGSQAREVRYGVEIHRARAIRVRQTPLALKLANQLTVALGMALKVLTRVPRRDVVLLVSAPSFAIHTVGLICRLKRVRYHVLMHDLFPDVLEVTGAVPRGGIVSRVWRGLNRFFLRRAETVVVLGRDMRERVAEAIGVPLGDVVIITNTADVENIDPLPRTENSLLKRLGLLDAVVVKHSGHLGRTHDIEGIVEAARRLAGDPDVRFLFIGDGPKRAWLEWVIAEESLDNVTVVDFLPKSEIRTSMTAGDLSLVAMLPGMSGLSVPSRIYDYLAAGQPVVAMADRQSEICRIVEEEGIGWIVPPRDVDGLVAAIREARSDPARLSLLGRRSRAVAEEKYLLSSAVRAYRELLLGPRSVD